MLDVWEQFLVAVFAQGKARDWDILALSPKLVANLTSKGFLGLFLVSLWWWNWQLLFSVGAAVALMWLSLKCSSQQLTKFWYRTQVLFRKGHNHRLFWAGLSGSLGGIFSYMALAIWSDTPNHWLAVASIAQGLMTLAILLIVVRQLFQHKQESNAVEFTQLVQSLAEENMLKRLIAVRQLTDLVGQGKLSEEQSLQLQEYFGFMLNQPQELTVQNALIDGLEVVKHHNLPPVTKPTLLSPLQIKHALRELS